ncbi:MAG: hypothetical protein ACXVZ1_12370 [Gaiellaceae bacterium]
MLVPVALADISVVPHGSAPPWADSRHEGPLERVSSRIASRVAQRKVSVRCETPRDWEALLQKSHSPATTAGLTTGAAWDPRTHRFVTSAKLAHLAPRVCQYLQRFAEAAVKPTTCSGAPCYGEPGAVPDGGWARYSHLAYSIETLAHESIHLFDNAAGQRADLPQEKRAECFGMQWVPWVAEQLGDSAADGRALAEYLYRYAYPQKRGTTYWSSDCREGGSLDLTPKDGTWP